MTKSQKLNEFEFEGRKTNIIFVESVEVTTGVVCDVYKFEEDESKDLGIIEIKAGMKTPSQKVLKGERTVEGFISGYGELIIIKENGEKVAYIVGNETKYFSRVIQLGEIMQWQADPDSDLKVYEVCYPPYKEGRYENLT